MQMFAGTRQLLFRNPLERLAGGRAAAAAQLQNSVTLRLFFLVLSIFDFPRKDKIKKKRNWLIFMCW
jgi:hypothetical protein